MWTVPLLPFLIKRLADVAVAQRARGLDGEPPRDASGVEGVAASETADLVVQLKVLVADDAAGLAHGGGGVGPRVDWADRGACM